MIAIALGSAPAASQGQSLNIEVENLSPTGGFFLTPLWYGLHDGSFDLFDIGGTASNALEQLAEEGNTAPLEGEFAGPGRVQGVITGPAGFGSVSGQPPLIDTGETATGMQAVMDPASYRYFSFASMVIPSNDAFIGNDSGTAYELFDAAGNFNGPLVIEILGSDIWDSGTEVNDTMGAAFSTIGGTATDENGTVQMHPGLANFEGTGTPVGLIGAGLAPGPTTPVARITITQVPEPTAAVLLTLVAISWLGTRSRR